MVQSSKSNRKAVANSSNAMETDVENHFNECWDKLINDIGKTELTIKTLARKKDFTLFVINDDTLKRKKEGTKSYSFTKENVYNSYRGKHTIHKDLISYVVSLLDHLKKKYNLNDIEKDFEEQEKIQETETDNSLNNLTQEFVFNRLIEVDINPSPKENKVTLKGSITDYNEKEKEKTRIGKLGEELVMQYEQERLKNIGLKPEQKSESEGDGLGYDILSYDEKGNEVFIEVKTTKNGANTPFYITYKELEKSKQENDRFVLYRLYDFDENNKTSRFFKQTGDLTKWCGNPILYKALP